MKGRPSAIRARLAKRIEAAFLTQHSMKVMCDPRSISFPRGFYRTNLRSDTFRWSAICKINDTNVGPIVDSYDTATSCARFGVMIAKQPYNRGWEATADTEANLLRDANSKYSSVQIEELARTATPNNRDDG